MARKTKAPTLEQIQDALQAHSFEVTAAPGVPSGLWVAKYGCAAVLMQGTGATAAPGVDPGSDTVVAFRERPGAVVKGEIARLLDRGGAWHHERPVSVRPRQGARGVGGCSGDAMGAG